jgi:enolase
MTAIVTLEGYRGTKSFTKLNNSLQRDHSKIERFLGRKPEAGVIRDIRAIPDQMGGRFPKETYRVLLFTVGKTVPYYATLPAGISEGIEAARLTGTAEGVSLQESHSRASEYLQNILLEQLKGRNVAELEDIEAEFADASAAAIAINSKLGPYEHMGAQNSLGITQAIAYAIAGLTNVPVTSVINYFYNQALRRLGHDQFEPISLPMVQGVLGDCGKHGLKLTLNQMVERGIMTAEGRAAFPVQMEEALPVIAPQEALALYHRFGSFDAMIRATERVSARYLKILKGIVPEDTIHRGAESGYTSTQLTSLERVLQTMLQARTGKDWNYEKAIGLSLDVALSELVLTPEATRIEDILCYIGPELAGNATGAVPLIQAYRSIVDIARRFGMPIVEDLAPEAGALRGLSREEQIAAMALAGSLLNKEGIDSVADDPTVGNPALAEEFLVRGLSSDKYLHILSDFGIDQATAQSLVGDRMNVGIALWILLKDTQSGTFLKLVNCAALARRFGIRLNNSHRGNGVAGERWPGHLAVGLGTEICKFTPWGTGRGEKIVAMREIEAIYQSQGIELPFWANPEHTSLFKSRP